jgi:hypothetical protein
MHDMQSHISAGKGHRAVRNVFAVLAWLLTACIAIQALLAGAAVFHDPKFWQMHNRFVPMFEWLPLVMLILAFPGKFAASVKWSAAALFVLIVLQYVTANFTGIGMLHTVIALFMFLLAYRTAVSSLRA